MNDLISVIVPIYKVEEWLEDCIKSIVHQSYTNLEIVLVDDGSPDKCPKICDDWAGKDKRIKVIHKENGGLSSARNVALDIITGDYISFVDSDDYIHPDMYKIMLQDIKRTNADIVRCSNFIDEEGKIYHKNVIGEAKTYNRDEILDCYFYHRDDFCSGVWNKLYRAELFNEIRFPDGLNSEDYYVYAIIYGKTNKLFYNNVPLYYYRIRENSICRTPYIDDHSFDKIIVSDKVYEYVKKAYPEREKDAQIFQAISRFTIYHLLMQMKHTKEMEYEWKKQLKEKRNIVLTNKKVGAAFKIKYFILSTNLRLYMRIKGKKIG